MSSRAERQRRENQRQRSWFSDCVLDLSPYGNSCARVYLALIALYARTRLLKMTGKKEYYREEKTE